MSDSDLHDDDHDFGGEPEESPAKKRDREEQVVRLLTTLFKRFVAAHDVDRARWHAVPPHHLFAWVRDQEPTLDKDALMAEAGADDEDAFDTVLAMAHSQAGPMAVLSVWPRVVLHDRPLPAVPIRQVVIDLLVHFADDTTLVVTSNVPQEAVSQPIGDDMLCAIIREVAGNFADVFYLSPLDEMRKSKATYNAGEQGYQFFMGLVLKAIYGLKEPHRRVAMSWFRLFQQLAIPPLPRGALGELVAHKEAWLRQQAAEDAQLAQGDQDDPAPAKPQPPPPSPQSGWDG